MRVKIKRFDKKLELPKYQTRGAAAFDLHARETVRIKPGQVGYVPLNIAIQPPKGYFFLLAARSSTHKQGLMMANGLAVGDPDFCGDADEYSAPLLNFSPKTVTVEKGDRIAQGMFVKFIKAELEEVPKMKNKNRGGYGSTGKK